MNTDILNNLIWVELNSPDDFLKIKETLSRIGIASQKDNTLYQTAHILHKKGRYAIVHFKQLFILDGKQSTFTEEDQARINTIANLLHDWNLCDLVDPDKTESLTVPISQIKIIPFKDKANWNLVAKYTIGNKK